MSTRKRPLSLLYSLVTTLLIGVLAACSGVEDAVPAPGAEPTVQILGPSDRATITSDVVTMTCVVGEDVERVSYTVNGGEPVEVEFSSLEYSFPLQGLVEGENTVELTVENSQGLTSQTRIINWLPIFPEDLEANDDEADTAKFQLVNINVLRNDEGRGLEIVEIGEADNGNASLRPGALPLLTRDSILYQPDAEFSGTDTFTYTVEDRSGERDTATVTVTVDPNNPNAPIANDDTATTTAGTLVNIRVLDNDESPNGRPLTISDVTQPENGSVFNNGSVLRYTPDDGFTGTDTFTYTIFDDDGFNQNAGVDTATVTVTVE